MRTPESIQRITEIMRGLPCPADYPFKSLNLLEKGRLLRFRILACEGGPLWLFDGPVVLHHQLTIPEVVTGLVVGVDLAEGQDRSVVTLVGDPPLPDRDPDLLIDGPDGQVAKVWVTPPSASQVQSIVHAAVGEQLNWRVVDGAVNPHQVVVDLFGWTAVPKADVPKPKRSKR